MDVKCNNCGTEYSLDETLVAASGTSVRCTKCSEVFKVYPPSRALDSAAGRDQWLLRQVGGATYPFERMAVLQQWIADGKVSENDLLSRDGGPWKRLADIPELAPFLAQAKQVAPVAAGFPRADQSGKREPTIRQAGPSNAAFSSTVPQTAVAKEPGDETRSRIPLAQTVLAQPTAPMQPPQGGPTTLSPPAHAGQPQPGMAQPGSVPPVATPAPAPPQHHPFPSAQQLDTTLLQAPAEPAYAPPDQAVGHMPTMAQQMTSPITPAPLTTSESAPTPATPPPQEIPSPMPAADEPDLSQVPAAREDSHWDQGEEMDVAGPTWAEKAATLPRYEDEDDTLPPPKRKVGRWIALFVIVGLLGGGFYLVKFKQDTVQSLINQLTSAENDRYKKFFDHGKESFLLDSDTYYRQADREFQKVLALEENHAPTLAALAEMYAVWAQYLRDAELDARTDGSTEASNREVDRLHREYKEKLAEAAQWAEQAVAAKVVPAEAHRAMADVKRLQGEPKEALKHLSEAKKGGSAPETDYVALLLKMDEGKPAGELAEGLAGVIRDTPLIRAIYRRARVLANQGRAPDAKQALAKLFELNSDHLRGRDLAARIDEKKPIALVTSAETQPAAKPDAGIQKEEKEAAASQDVEPDPAASPTPEKNTASASRSGGSSGSGGFGGNTEALLMKAARMQESGRTGEAVKMFERVLERSPSNIDALSGLAYCYLDKGASGRAISHFRRALGANPTFGPALLGLAETFKATGQKEQALKYYKKYIAAHPGGRQVGMAKRNASRIEAELGPPADKPATPASPGDEQPAPKAEQPAEANEKPATPPADAPKPTSPEPPATSGSGTPADKNSVIITAPDNP